MSVHSCSINLFKVNFRKKSLKIKKWTMKKIYLTYKLLYIVEVWGKLSWHKTWGENSICGGVYSWEWSPTECKVDQHHHHHPAHSVLVITTGWSCSQCWRWHHTAHTGDGDGGASEQLQQCPPPPLGSDWPQCRGWCWPLLTEPETAVLCHSATATPALCTTSPGEPWTRDCGYNTLDRWTLFSCQCLDSVLYVVATWLAHTKITFSVTQNINRFVRAKQMNNRFWPFKRCWVCAWEKRDYWKQTRVICAVDSSK